MDEQKAYNTAIRMLGAREHSEHELRGKLARRYSGLEKEQIDQLIAELKDLNLQSDLRFTETLIRSRVRKGYGPFYIQQELASKGIDKQLIHNQIEAADIDWLTSAQDLAERRFPDAANDEAVWSKATRFLQRRGFAGQIISVAVGERPVTRSNH